MARPKGTKNKPKIYPPVENVDATIVVAAPEVSQSDKHYIWVNWGKLSIDEISKHTKLSREQVETIAVSSELDTEPLTKDGVKLEKIRRFAVHAGSVSMTPQQSILDDSVYHNNLPNQAEVNARIPGLEQIQVKSIN